MWLAGSLDTSSASASAVKTSSGAIGDDSPTLLPWGSGERDYADAEKLWRKYSTPARAMFSLMIDHPDQHFTGDQIAEAIEIPRSEEHTSELQSRFDLVCRLLLEKKNGD